MNTLKKIVIVYFIISIFSGCAYFIDKLKPGFLNDITEYPLLAKIEPQNLRENKDVYYSEDISSRPEDEADNNLYANNDDIQDDNTIFFDHQPEQIEHQNPVEDKDAYYSEDISSRPEDEADNNLFVSKESIQNKNIQDKDSKCMLDDSACIVEDYPIGTGSTGPGIGSTGSEIGSTGSGIGSIGSGIGSIGSGIGSIKQPKICTGEKVSKHWHNLNKVVVATNFLNIRSNYGVNQPVIGSAKRCEKLTVIGKHVERVRGNKKIKSRGWLKIVTQSGVTGWVAGWHTGYIED
jgi:hypothetical protein